MSRQVEPGTRSIVAKARDAYSRGGARRLLRMGAARLVHPFRIWLSQTRLGRQNAPILMRAWLTGTPVVHVVGDSHTDVLRGHAPFVVTWLGPATAHNLGNRASATSSGKKLATALRRVRKNRDVVLLVLGEIDSRIHIYDRHMKSGGEVPMERLIDETIERFGQVAVGLSREGYHVVVQSVPATPYQENIYDYPFYGSDATRAWIVARYNARLAAWCADRGVPYLDIYAVAADERGFIRKELTDDGTHLNAGAMQYYDRWVEGLR